MAQTRGQSAVETAVGTAVGLLVSIAANMLVLPVFGFHPKLGEAGLIGVIFTAVSVARSYLMRRLFNCPEFQVPFRPAAETKTLRDEFAMAAMQGLMTPMTFDLTVEDISEIAIISYLQADAMLTERAKR